MMEETELSVEDAQRAAELLNETPGLPNKNGLPNRAGEPPIQSHMKRIYTHYDNLKVARNAPTEVIRAAYKTLLQKYHPDRNPDDPDANRIITVINASYDVLSDSKKRQEHDLWINQQEAEDRDAHTKDKQA